MYYFSVFQIIYFKNVFSLRLKASNKTFGVLKRALMKAFQKSLHKKSNNFEYFRGFKTSQRQKLYNLICKTHPSFFEESFERK